MELSAEGSRWNDGPCTKLEPIALTATLMPGSLRKEKDRTEGDPGHPWAVSL